MKLHIVGTGSTGNCYILEGETSALIIECGKSFKDVKKSLDFNIEKIAGCIVSHEHGDHSKFILDFLNSGIECYSKLFFNRKLDHSNRLNQIEHKKSFIVGEFTVMPFDVVHDVPTFGFLIHHQECGNVLFLTDTISCNHKFPALNQVLIESNYSDEIIDRKFGNKFVRDRILNSHMELKETIKTLQNCNLTQCNNIVLIHLSDSNSDEKQFKSEVEKATGKKTTVASNGMIIDFNKNMF